MSENPVFVLYLNGYNEQETGIGNLPVVGHPSSFLYYYLLYYQISKIRLNGSHLSDNEIFCAK